MEKETIHSNSKVAADCCQETKQQMVLVVTEEQISFRGFKDIFQLFGFIDIVCSPQRLKQKIVESIRNGDESEQLQKKAEQKGPVAINPGSTGHGGSQNRAVNDKVSN